MLWKALITRYGGHATESLDVSSLAKITDGYTPGHMAQAIQQILTERRIQQVRFLFSFWGCQEAKFKTFFGSCFIRAEPFQPLPVSVDLDELLQQKHFRTDAVTQDRLLIFLGSDYLLYNSLLKTTLAWTVTLDRLLILLVSNHLL